MTRALRIAIAGTAAALATFPSLPAPAQSVSAQSVPAQSGIAPYTVVESGQGFSRLQEAVNAIGEGKGTIRFASLRFADCAVQEAGEIAYVAQVPGEAVLDGVACEGKAALVLRGRAARVEGLTFANIRVPDVNGAGIRLERGGLVVTQSWFRDSEQGILTADDEASAITIDKSTFTRLGTCAGGGGCAHSLYTGNYATLTVTRSRFEQGRGGHYLKTRAGRVIVRDNSFDDSGGRATNYMIDLSAGAAGEITGNWFVQGRDKENWSAFITVAPEAKWHSSTGLAIAGNDARFAPGVSRESTFVADWSGDALAIGRNALGAGLKAFDQR